MSKPGTSICDNIDCGTELPANAKFCLECGRALTSKKPCVTPEDPAQVRSDAQVVVATSGDEPMLGTQSVKPGNLAEDGSSTRAVEETGQPESPVKDDDITGSKPAAEGDSSLLPLQSANTPTVCPQPEQLSDHGYTATPVGPTSHVGTTPGATPVCNILVGATPVGATPFGNTPVGATTPVDTTPVGTTHDGTTHVGTTHVGTTHVGTTHVGTTHVGTTHVGTTHVGTTHVGTTHDGTTHVGTTHVGTTYVGTTHDGTTHVGTTPVGATLVGATPVGTKTVGIATIPEIGAAKKSDYKGNGDEDLLSPHLKQGGHGTCTSGEQPYKKPSEAPELFPGHAKQNTAGSQNTADKADISGFHCTPENSIAITFHVLLPYHVWEWNQQSKLVMFFGHHKLGNWGAYAYSGDFTERDVGGGLWETTAKIDMQASLLNDASAIPYKYAVLNCRSDNIKSHFEFLHGAPGIGEPVNRCLIVPTSLFQSRGGFMFVRNNELRNITDQLMEEMVFASENVSDQRVNISQSKNEGPFHFHQFDTMVYPEFISKLSTLLSHGIIPDSVSMRHKCLMTYLERLQHDLEHCFATSTLLVKVDQVVNDAIQIVTALATQRIAHPHGGKVKISVWEDCKIVSSMLKDWIFPIVDVVKNHPVNTAEDSGKKVMTGIIIICIIAKLLETKKIFPRDIKPRYAASILRTLCLHPDLQNKKCLDFDFVQSVIPGYYVKCATTAISDLGYYLMNIADIDCAEWLYCLPILHFLNNDVKPFDMPDLPVNELEFPDRYLQLGSILIKVAHKEGFFNKYFEKLKPLLSIDPILKRAFTYICPRKDRTHLIRSISPYLCIALMIKRLDKKTELDYWSSDLVLQHIEEITVCLKASATAFNPSFMLDATIQLLFASTKVIRSNTEHYLKVYKAIVVLVFSAALHLSTSDSDVINDKIDKIQQYFSDWVSDVEIIGQGMFGGASKKIVEELQIWVSLFAAECPVEFTEQWHGVVKTIVESRVNMLTPENKISLLCILESCWDTPDVLKNLFTEAAIAALDSINDQGTAKDLVKFYSEACKKSTQHVGKVLTSLISKRYPNGKESISFDEILDWELWSSYIRIYSALPDECVLMCTYAQSKLEEMWGQMMDATIVMSELEKVSQHQQNMENLCCTVGDGIKEPHQKQQWSIETVHNIIQQRIKELTFFHDYRKKLKYLCSLFPNTADFADLRKELNCDISGKSIGSLCTISEGNIIYHCLKSASPLQDMLNRFSLLAQNELFMQIWQENVSQGGAISIAVVSQQIWPKAYSHAQQLMKALLQRTMKLADVDHYLSKYKAADELTAVLVTLNNYLNTCAGILDDGKWIRNVVDTVMYYWSLKEHEKAAKTFLRLKEELKLTGSFLQVERLASQVSVSMKDQTLLQVVDESLVKAGHFLGQHKEKLHCLETFIKCQGVVQWLQKETKDVVDLQCFVNVSLTTSAGEGDLANDKLSTLSIVGTGYRSLIYELKPDAGFETLTSGCSTIWKDLDENPNLPKLLEDCNSELEWYKSVKATQGRVEVTSFELMKNILQYGYYTVEAAHLECGSINDAVCVDLDDKKLSNKRFKLDELRDLESRLVLITGNKAEYRRQVDHFLDTLHSICHIAHILLNLQQAGNVKYLNWKMIARCADNELLVGELEDKARKMEDDLNKWKEEVKKSRMKYYELNNYTTAQLVILRRELGKMKNDYGVTTVDPGVMLLLHSISPDLTPAAVKESMHNLLTEMLFPVNQRVEVMFIEQHDQFGTQASPISINENLQVQHQSTASVLIGTETLNEFEANSNLESVSGNMKQSATICQDKQSATLTVEQLTGKLKDIYINLTDFYGYPSHDVLSALEHCGEDMFRCVDYIRSLAHLDIQLDDESSDSEPEVAMDQNEQEPDHQTSTSDEIHVAEATVATMKPIEAVESIDEHSSSLVEKTNTSDIVIYANTGDKQIVEFLTLSELGLLLEEFRTGNHLQQQRQFSKQLKLGTPNLLITTPDNVLKTVLSLYMEDPAMPLPSLEEVLICTQQTTEEEVTLLWRRAIGDPGFKRLFCLVHAEKLSYQVCERALSTLAEITQGKIGYHLVIICTNEGEEKSRFVSTLHAHQQQYTPLHTVPDYCKYLKSKFTTISPSQKLSRGALACEVDYENSCVRVVKSNRSGMGKSLYIQKMAKKLELKSSSSHLITIPIHGPVVTPDIVLRFLQNHINESTIIHFDVSSKVLRQVDTLLFSLLVLRGLCDSHGSVWRFHPSQLCTVEVTVPVDQVNDRPALSLLELLPTVDCVTPYEAHHLMKSGQKSPEKHLMDEEEFHDPAFQCVYQYLKRHIGKRDLDSFSFNGVVEGNPADCLHLLLESCGVQSPSWLEIKHFVIFLDIQLRSCQNSVFCNASHVHDIMKGLKGFVVKFMIQMSKDFATPSLKGEDRAARGISQDDILKDYQISKRKQWEQSPHPYIFFNEDRNSITFLGFKVNMTGDLINPADNNVIEKAILSPPLMAGLKRNGVNFNEDYRTWSQNKQLMLQKLETVLGLVKPKDPDVSYVLTVDNLIKILAIQMRFRCGIPVVIMGETGCGKTRLIRYMCDLIAQGPARNTMFILKVHGGTTEDDIMNAVNQAEAVAQTNSLGTVLFFDEANTTDAIGLIKEIMCDHRMNGKPISKYVKFIAACNPYRKHTDKMIKKLESAGLGFYVKSTETQDRLDKIPLRQLVYRVLDLPPSMRPLVYDFGQLNMNNETEYIQQIVKNYFKDIQPLSPYETAVATVLAVSQAYMRNCDDECSFVSLRDVERCMIVFEYFFKQKDLFSPLMDVKATKENKVPLADPVTRSLVLALSICYHARLQDRSGFEQDVSQKFPQPLALPGGAEQFKDEIKWCQEVLLDGMLLGPNIARNSALRENVFMMVICIELRIPLFVVGKPGSSKSLAKSIVSTSMQGISSRNNLLRNFKQVHMFSYQCSQLSTPESVIEVFKTAAHFQQNRNVAEFVSVVVLDEVGLAEDSPNLPLKALHPLLEDGTEGADDKQQIIAREKRVAFIGISNWALDPAKMNRGVMLTRGEPSSDELALSARGICSNQDNDRVRERLEALFHPLSEAYVAICKKQDKDFFGLRDFYSLIKMLYWICAKSNAHPLNWQSLEHAIRRNFGGFEQFDPVKVFREHIPLPADAEHGSIPDELRDIVSPGCSQLDLIKASLKTRKTTWHGENRYLLFLTENYAALRILHVHHYLQDIVAISPAKSRDQMDEQTDTFNQVHMEPFVLFGSSFPKDKEYTQVCRNINQIKICMETGRTVILLNLESLYESLYDVLNQYYIYHGENRYVDLGLQTHRVKCRVHNNFRLILIAEKTTVHDKFPTPLINRLEKHFVLTKSILTTWQQSMLETFDDWIDQFCNIKDLTRNKKFTREDAFVGYQNDTPAAVIFQAAHSMSELQKQLKSGSVKNHVILDLAHISADMYVTVEEGSEAWCEVILMQSKWSLLQTASPAALIRLKISSLLQSEVQLLNDIYFIHQHHSSLFESLFHSLNDSTLTEGLLMQITTSSHLLTNNEVDKIADGLNMPKCHVSCYLLQEFSTELDFCNKISLSFKRGHEAAYNTLLIIQCEAGHLYGDLIACARYRVYDERAKAVHINSFEKGTTHVVFIIQLPPHTSGSSFVGFQGDPWISAHIDELHSSESDMLTLSEAMNYKISELFVGASHRRSTMLMDEDALEMSQSEMECSSQLPQITPQHKRLYSCIQAAAAVMLRDMSNNKERAIKRIAILHDLIPKYQQKSLDDHTFYGALVGHIYKVLQKRDEIVIYDKDWVLNVALNRRRLQQGGTFRNSLTRRLDEVIIPIFAAVVAFCDQYCNLNLIRGTNEDDLVLRFWLSMLKTSDVIMFNYEDMATSPKSDIERGRASEDFECKMPFFWIIKEAIDSMRNSVSNYAGNSFTEILKQLCSIVSQTPLGEVMGSVPDSAQLYDCYLHDYVRSVHKCYHKIEEVSMLENNLVTDALNQLTCGIRFCSIDGHRSLLEKICTLHVVYENHTSELLWFGQLTQKIPSIVYSIHPANNPDEMVLHLHAAKEAFQYLETPILENQSTLEKWMRDVQRSQNALDSILFLPTTPVSFSRHPWYLILVMKLFVEHIMSKHGGTVVYARRLHLLLKAACVDFHEADSVATIKEELTSMYSELSKIKGKSQLKALRSDCHVFFMEVVSTLCFGYGTPEDKLIKMLIDTVYIEHGDDGVTTKKLTYTVTKTDSVPVIRSFLMKLLVDQKSEQVKVHLQDYFEKSKLAVSGVDQGIDQGLCLLFAQCFEDSTYKKLSVKTLKEIADEDVADILEKAYTLLCAQYMCQFADLSVLYLEKIAHMRCGLSVVAEILHRQVTADEDPIIAPRLMQIANKICTDKTINSSDKSACTGPSVFLVKLIVRQYGLACLYKIADKYPWVVPESILNQGQDNRSDPFVVYGSEYVKIRDAVNGAIYGNLVNELSDAVKPQMGYKVSYLPLSIFKVATLSKASLQPSKQIHSNAAMEFDKFITDQSQLGTELMTIARALLVNEQGGPLVQLQVSPQQPSLARDLTILVVHTAIVLSARKDTDVLAPFLNMLNNPIALVNAFLPTMPEDNLPDIRRAFSETFYQCPKGHPYCIGNCGKPGAKIGGLTHALVENNSADLSTDETPTGHTLGSPDGRSNTLPERGLSSAACCILRALMHSALLWASCNTQAGLVQLIKPPLMEHEIPEFLWKHLEKDITLLGRALGRSVDEAILVIHLVLKDILVKDVPKIGVVQSMGTLAQRASRDSWESLINQTYMQPFLREWDQRVETAMQAMLNDQSKDQAQLFFTVYERAKPDEESTEPHFWIYRPRISLEHLNQMLLANNHDKEYPLLYAFIQEEPNLRATQYLPDIVQLQQYLYNKCNGQFDRKDGKMTISQLIKREKAESTRVQLHKMISSLSKAWKLVHERLPEHARLRVDHKYLVPSISLETNLDYLIPTTTGAGVCTTSLVDFLVCKHNDFMEKCRGDKWVLQKLPLRWINSCHVVDYEHQLLPIILSHCHYSLTYGKGQKIEYDFPALEKHILDRFIYGKPHIMLEIPYVVFKENRYAETTFRSIRKKVQQETLSHELQEQIVKELSLMHKLKEAMDAVEIILMFVSSGGAKAEKNLGEYAERALRMDRQFCSVAQKYCKLKHIVSLWQTISVELARQLALKGQEPFEELDKGFLETLAGDQVAALNKVLHSYDIEILLGILFEFIETHLRHSSSELEKPLQDTVQAFVDTCGISLGTDYFDQLTEIKLRNNQTVAVWKYIVVYQDKQRRGR